MAADLSDHRANAILDALPTGYLALSSTLPNLDGTNITEPGQGDYVRPRSASPLPPTGRA